IYGAHVVAFAVLPRLCRALPAEPRRAAAGRGWVAARNQTRRLPNAVRRDAGGVRLFTRNGHDWTGRFPLIERAPLSLKAASCLIDGEAVACDDDGLPVFDRLRYRRQDGRVFLYAFDLIELNGDVAVGQSAIHLCEHRAGKDPTSVQTA